MFEKIKALREKAYQDFLAAKAKLDVYDEIIAECAEDAPVLESTEAETPVAEEISAEAVTSDFI